MLQRLLYVVDPEMECYMLSSQSGLLYIVGVHAPVLVQSKLCILFELIPLRLFTIWRIESL